MGWLSSIKSVGRLPMENYKGLHIGCAPGTHKALVEMLLRHTPPLAGVLDIGAHAGALLNRLGDAGFTDLSGTDLDATNFKLPGATFRKLELNAPFAQEFNRRFSLITCTDVLEHLDSPRNFMTQAFELLDPGGWLAISIPNVAFWEGRCKFMLKGELWGFGARNYTHQRHISPMTIEQFHLTLEEMGFRPVEWITAGSFASPVRRAFMLPISLPLRLVGGRSTWGESLIFLAQKAAPNANLKRPHDYREQWVGEAENAGRS